MKIAKAAPRMRSRRSSELCAAASLIKTSCSGTRGYHNMRQVGTQGYRWRGGGNGRHYRGEIRSPERRFPSILVSPGAVERGGGGGAWPAATFSARASSSTAT